MAEYLSGHGYKNLTVLDERAELEELPPHSNVQLGNTAFSHLTNFDIIFRSPGIKLTHPGLKSAIDAGVEMTSVTKFFFEKCPSKIIGISGTKGKGTTSTLTYQILKNAGFDVYLGGNIGEPPVNFLDRLKKDSIVVLELSSFQLEDLQQSPHISIVLNITSDHLDYHPDVFEYRKAKESLVRYQKPEDIAIINADYEGSMVFGDIGEGQKYSYSRSDVSANITVLGEKIAKKSDISLRGTHNYENVLPACMVGKILGVSNAVIAKTLREFKGLPHRLELVAEKNGVQYVNDSFSTTPETSMAGVRAFHEPLYLIAGGSEKHSNFKEWAHACAKAENLKMVLLIGLTAQRMEDELQDAIEENPRKAPLDIVRVKDLDDAFAFLKNQVKKGDVVLMSPACASFDQFKNYKERGERFKALAKK